MSVLAENKSKGIILRRKGNWRRKMHQILLQKNCEPKRYHFKTAKRKWRHSRNNKHNQRMGWKFLHRTKKTTDTDITTELLETINKTDDNVVLTQDFTLTELDKCLKTFKKGKSPGEDGLPLEFYLTFWEILASDLLTVLKDLEGLSRLPDSFRQWQDWLLKITHLIWLSIF